MSKRVKKDLHEMLAYPHGRRALPGQPRVDPRSTIERYFIYAGTELRVIAYRGNRGDINISTVRGIAAVVQYVVKGRYTYSFPGRPDMDYQTGDHRDTFDLMVPDAVVRYEITQNNTEFLCVQMYDRTAYDYEIMTVNPNQRLSLPGPGPGDPDHFIYIFEGAIDWLDDDGVSDDRQLALVEHREIGVGDDGDGVAVGKTTLIIVR